MSKTTLVVVLGFALAYAAGLVTGYAWRRTPQDASAAATQPTTRRSFALALGLTPPQDAQIRAWREEAFREAMREMDDQRAALRRQRDDAIFAMLSPENRLVYETVMQQYTAAMDQLQRERPKAFERLDERIQGILTPDQRVKFNEMLKRRAEEHRHREFNRRGEGATTRPATTNPSRENG